MNRRDRQRIDDIVAAGRNVAEIASEGWPNIPTELAFGQRRLIRDGRHWRGREQAVG